MTSERKQDGKKVFRLKKHQTFTSIDNESLRDRALTYKATGLLALMLSMPEDWRFNSADLSNRKMDGRDAVRSGMNELERLGYLEKEVLRADTGTVETIIRVYEAPHLNPKYRPRKKRLKAV